MEGLNLGNDGVAVHQREAERDSKRDQKIKGANAHARGAR